MVLTPLASSTHPSNSELFIRYDQLPDKPIWTTESIKSIHSYNPKRAKELLAEAGYPSGFTTWIDYFDGYEPGLAEVFQRYLADIGIKAELRVHNDRAEWDAFRMGKKQQQIVIHFFWYPQPLYQLSTWQPGSTFNMSYTNDPWFNAKFEQANTTFDRAERYKLIHEMELRALEMAFYVSFPYPYMYNVWQPWIGGYQGEGSLARLDDGLLGARIWVDQDLKKTLTGK